MYVYGKLCDVFMLTMASRTGYDGNNPAMRALRYGGDMTAGVNMGVGGMGGMGVVPGGNGAMNSGNGSGNGGNAGNNPNAAGSGPPPGNPGAGPRRASRRDERYHPYR